MNRVKILIAILLFNVGPALGEDARATTGDPREFFVVNKFLHDDVVELRSDRKVDISDFWTYKPERPRNVPKNAVLVTVIRRSHTQAIYEILGWAWISKEACDILHGRSEFNE